MTYPIEPPIEPMLAKLTDGLPPGADWLFEPKWDGFRAIVFRDGDQLYTQSRDLRPLDRYFPELRQPLLDCLPPRCVIDGEIVIAGANGLDFDALQLRLHPAASRVAMLAKQTPSSFVAFDLLARGDEDLRGRPQRERREMLVDALGHAHPPIHLTPATTDRALAADWFRRFEGAGLDGVIARKLESTYQPGKRTLVKVKHARTADCVVAGFRWHKNGPGTLIGSLLLGLHDDEGRLHHVGITSSFTMAKRADLVKTLEPYRTDALVGHPWESWARHDHSQRRPGMTSRWNADKDLSWEPLRAELVAEVGYDHLQGSRFRHTTTFKRWRPDRLPSSCRYDQLATTPPFELSQIFRGQDRPT